MCLLSLPNASNALQQSQHTVWEWLSVTRSILCYRLFLDVLSHFNQTSYLNNPEHPPPNSLLDRSCFSIDLSESRNFLLHHWVKTGFASITCRYPSIVTLAPGPPRLNFSSDISWGPTKSLLQNQEGNQQTWGTAALPSCRRIVCSLWWSCVYAIIAFKYYKPSTGTQHWVWVSEFMLNYPSPIPEIKVNFLQSV